MRAGAVVHTGNKQQQQQQQQLGLLQQQGSMRMLERRARHSRLRTMVVP
jgi:hypothetical protein